MFRRVLSSAGRFSYYLSILVFGISFFVVSIVLVLENILVFVSLIGVLILLSTIYVIGYLGRWKNNPKVKDDSIFYMFE